MHYVIVQPAATRRYATHHTTTQHTRGWLLAPYKPNSFIVVVIVVVPRRLLPPHPTADTTYILHSYRIAG